MKPFQGEPERGSIERVFNYLLSRGRRVVENAFGIASSVFRVLRKPMLLSPDKARKVVLAIIHLHNFLRKKSSSQYKPHGSLDMETDTEIILGSWRNDSESSSLLPITNLPRRSGNDAKEIRLHLAKHFVTNGEIPWQNI
ncbi:unnamed protein product [Acanthoscelides obtectus]|uniref:DDE Tnp4 domain-containing protein n=1 Tax=Acanthoscelides obtectus TaxID=200917 RepID=A0A9P0M5V8_ACAOB|nr:unnamed protein product [Acanthoscelides obtectus]CAK1656060.1 hypothetical protein AOBTE_LOCUS19553 [Acanthoscelides obtectus]